jgi:hypothetical protein
MKIKIKAKSFKLKTISSFIKKNYFLLIFIGCVGFVGLVAFYKLFISKPTYVYVKVKVGQGMWWATTQKPSLWFVKAIEQAKEQKDLAGKPLVKVLNVSYYPYYGSSQYDVYVTAKLKVSNVSGKGTYNFNRETIGVSSPIDFEFPTIQYSGTITEMSQQPIKESYIEKTIYLAKKYAYPWEFDSIQVGDMLTNGNRTLFQITDKAKGETNEALVNETGKLISTDIETYQYIIIQAKVQLKKIDNQLIYGEEYSIAPGRSFGFTTNHISLNDYFVTKVE